MNPFHFQFVPSPHPLGSPQFPMLPLEPPNSIHFGKIEMFVNTSENCRILLILQRQYIFFWLYILFHFFKLNKELEMLMMIKDGKVSLEDVKHGSNETYLPGFQEYLQDIRVNIESQ
ncbi:hypothetical protein Ahy_B10g101514 [Arachis hypogaea]|uniref:Uncharacterized protein n=1 Tax=Arachis hypogaea TaxID=3818 RepID=A0A444WZP5_ARAHY|nr:hypothetical protein Ahy_B10g101514 [Arachis hypogaea]